MKNFLLKVVSIYSVIYVSKKHTKTLEVIYAKPVQSGIRWNDVKTMLKF
ncbi:MAG: hypothetical protein ABFR75_13930 [Acidobacteriota bacterium]